MEHFLMLIFVKSEVSFASGTNLLVINNYKRSITAHTCSKIMKIMLNLQDKCLIDKVFELFFLMIIGSVLC